MIHQSKDHRDVSTLIGNLLQSPKGWNLLIEAPNTHPDIWLPRVCLLKLGYSICLIHIEVYLHALWVLLQPGGSIQDVGGLQHADLLEERS